MIDKDEEFCFDGVTSNQMYDLHCKNEFKSLREGIANTNKTLDKIYTLLYGNGKIGFGDRLFVAETTLKTLLEACKEHRQKQERTKNTMVDFFGGILKPVISLGLITVIVILITSWGFNKRIDSDISALRDEIKVILKDKLE